MAGKCEGGVVGANIVRPLDLMKRIEATRIALHAAIRRAGDTPLYRCPEVLRLSRELDGLINGMGKERGVGG